MKPPSADVDEPITLVEYDDQWPVLFEAERTRVKAALGESITRVEHFGSTAVPSLAGKPIIDLLVGVRDLATAHACVPRVEVLGYQNFGEIFIPGRLYLRRRGPPHFNIALTVERGEFWNAQLILRDYLRAHPREVLTYAASKRAAFDGGATLFSTYSQAKGRSWPA